MGIWFYIKDYDYEYFDYKTTHFGTSPVIVDKYTVNLKEAGYRVKIKIETCYWNRSDIDAVALFRLDHNGMKEKFYRPLIEELLRSRIPETKNDLVDIKNQLEIDLHNFWKDQLPYLKFEVIELGGNANLVKCYQIKSSGIITELFICLTFTVCLLQKDIGQNQDDPHRDQ